MSRPRRNFPHPVTAHHSGDGAPQSAHSCEATTKPWHWSMETMVFTIKHRGFLCFPVKFPIIQFYELMDSEAQLQKTKLQCCAWGEQPTASNANLRKHVENSFTNSVLSVLPSLWRYGCNLLPFFERSSIVKMPVGIRWLQYPGVPPFQGVLVVCQGRMPQLRSLPVWFKNRTLNRSDTSRSCRALDFKVLAGGVSADIAVTSSIASNAPFGYPVPFLLVEMPIHADCLGPTG